MVIAETSSGEPLFHLGASEWVAREPYAAAGGGVIGESPATTVTEFKVTPFDDLIYDDADASEASRLYPARPSGSRYLRRTTMIRSSGMGVGPRCLCG